MGHRATFNPLGLRVNIQSAATGGDPLVADSYRYRQILGRVMQKSGRGGTEIKHRVAVAIFQRGHADQLSKLLVKSLLRLQTASSGDVIQRQFRIPKQGAGVGDTPLSNIFLNRIASASVKILI